MDYNNYQFNLYIKKIDIGIISFNKVILIQCQRTANHYILIINNHLIIIFEMMNSLTIQMTGSEYPFGLIDINQQSCKKMLVKKRYPYKTRLEQTRLREKINKLKNIAHKNIINLRNTEDIATASIDLIYPYIPIPLEQSFNYNTHQTVRELHKQFIELAIHLAKNNIFTSFNSSRCGVVVIQKKSFVKYYLPLNEIMVTNNLGRLDRSVQLFSVQSMHYLDTLSQAALSTTQENFSQCSVKNQTKLQSEVDRSQSSSILDKYRKFSINPDKSPQMRKLSNLSKQFSEIRRKRTKQSLTRISSSSLHTDKFLNSEDSQRELLLLNHVYENKILKQLVVQLKERSLAAMKKFIKIQNLMLEQKKLHKIIKKIKQKGIL